MPDEGDRAVDNSFESVGRRHVQVLDLNVTKIGIERVLALAGLNPVEQDLGVSEQFALVAVGGQIPEAFHDVDDAADCGCLVAHF